ncbi:hypothetical protein PRIPAC_78808 [Pristionchus pacificus]|uniref:ABC transporter ATP-binding protein n=1 Tax=Pristionchus pacificus TaxID=54126 RepID=A0A2A6CQ88_PRIPA|nr:hypothetical protein PRIPAC_78808 [Pristionchus pacificus]|eukprot:PDM80201.1 ABC transporter ATP-binding protein [Pristionchus pacificus]
MLLSNVGWTTFTMNQCFKEMVTASSATKLVFSLLNPQLEKEDATSAAQFISDGAVQAESISFAYLSRPGKRVLNDVSFTVDRARSVAFVGPSGGGKSRLVNLLMRFYDPNSGQLWLDDTPFSALTPFQLRSNIALVSQEPVLFRATITDNIRLGVEEEVSDEQVLEACRLANAADFIRDFPEASANIPKVLRLPTSPSGYATVVGEKGRSLSGGQKQRIAIARALVRRPKMIVLDEATSALDSQSEKAVRVALESSAHGWTSVMIAHRLDAIRHCDEICYVEEGRIVERGTHTELVGKRAKYYEMTKQQRLS